MASKTKKPKNKKSQPKKVVKKSSKPAAKSKVSKAPAKKPASKVKARTQRKVTAPKSAAKTARVPRREKPAAPPPPSRAPRRMIFTAGQGAVVVSAKDSPEIPASSIESQEPAPEAAAPAAPEHHRVEDDLPPPPKISWSELPENFPPAVRFLVSNAEKECEKTGSWPFPFAKFIASLPKEVSGSAVAMMIMERDMDEGRVAEACRISPDEMTRIVSAAQRDIEESFSSKCGEIYRKWRAQLATPGKRAEAMCEPHLLSKVDRSFQLMIGELVIRAILAA